MISVKHVNEDRAETVYLCDVVNYYPDGYAPEAASNAVSEYPYLSFGLKEHTHILRGGEAFVMNEHGKTVARYSLRPAGLQGVAAGPFRGISAAR